MKEKVTLTLSSDVAAKLRHTATGDPSMPEIVEDALRVWFECRAARPVSRFQRWILRVFGLDPVEPARR